MLQLLPPLVSPRGRWSLPLAPAAVALVGNAAVGTPQGAHIESYLRHDPTLVLWAICAHRPDALPSLAHLAQDLWRTLAQRWSECSADGRSINGAIESLETCLGRVDLSVRTAELAAAFARVEGAEEEQAYLRGLLHAWRQWLEGGAEQRTSDASEVVPAWLAQPAGPEADCAAAAAKIVHQGKVPAGWAPAVWDGLTARGTEAARAWATPAALPVESLIALAQKLNRLEGLELRFDEELQAAKLRSLAEFAAGAGHEMNNPLAVIYGRAQLLLRRGLDPDARRDLALIAAQAMRVHEMIADLMLFARPPAIQPRSIELAGWLRELEPELRSLAAAQQTTLAIEGPVGPIVLAADPTQLAVALRAVVVNALEALRQGGNVFLRIAPRHDRLEIAVVDDGPGFPAEHAEHLFDPFFSGRAAGRGLGLGLSKAWRIVTEHGGTMTAHNNSPGALIRICLPLASEAGSSSHAVDGGNGPNGSSSSCS